MVLISGLSREELIQELKQRKEVETDPHAGKMFAYVYTREGAKFKAMETAFAMFEFGAKLGAEEREGEGEGEREEGEGEREEGEGEREEGEGEREGEEEGEGEREGEEERGEEKIEESKGKTL